MTRSSRIHHFHDMGLFIKSLGVALCSIFLGFTSLPAEITWEKPWQEFTQVSGDPAIQAVYRFQNTGSEPVTITRIKTTCGCTTANLTKKTYAQGESGQIEVKYEPGSKAGVFRKLVLVHIQGKPTPTELNIVAKVLSPAEVKPGLLFWRVGDPLLPKAAELIASPDSPVNIVRVTSSDPRFTAQVQTLQAGSRYSISLTPSDTSTKFGAVITVETDYPAERPRSYVIYTRVK